MEGNDIWQLSTVFLGGVATIAIFSFLWKENRFYRFFEHLFIGIATGLAPVLTIRDFLWPKIIVPMLGLNVVYYPDGTPVAGYNKFYLIYLLPMFFGLFYYTVYSKKLSWLSKLVIGFSLGASGGLAFKGFFAEIIPQLVNSFKPLVVMSGEEINYGLSLNNIVFVATLLIVMYYFFFTLKFGSGKNKTVTVVGRWLMMICFGAFFGSTVVARLALLVERVQFILTGFFPIFRNFPLS